MAQQAFADDVFTWPADEPQLIGGRCAECGTVTFPAQPSCPRCGATAMEQHLLARRGTLWTFTTQEFLPKEPYAERRDRRRRSGPSASATSSSGRGEGRGPAHRGRPRPKLRIGMEMELVIVPVPHRRRRQRDRDLRVPAGLRTRTRSCTWTTSPSSASGCTRSAASAGMSGHRHGRRSRSAPRSPTPASSGATSSSRSAAATRSTTPTRSSRCSGLTGIPFIDVYNGCATAASALQLAADTIRLGEHDLGIAVGMDKHLPGAFTRRPRRLRVRRRGTARSGTSSPRSSSAMKINRYMHDHGISHETLGEGRGQELPQRRAQPERVPAQAARRRRRSSASPDAQLPADAVHVLRARRGRGRGRAVPGRPARTATPTTPIYLRATTRAHPPLRRVRGAQPVAADRAGRRRRPSTRRGPRTRWPASGPRTST